MTEQSGRADRHPTDEPDGTPAHAASMRPVGESLTAGDAAATDADDEFGAGAEDESGAGADDEFAGNAGDGTPPFGRPVLPHESRAGYDVDDASGPTDAARPQ